MDKIITIINRPSWLFIAICSLLTACSGSQSMRVVLLPDTQTYAEKYPQVLDAQISWIKKNDKDIDLVIQQGDLTQNNSDAEWRIIQQAFMQLNNRVPYVLAVGNHDMGSTAGKFADTRNSTLFNTYFPWATMKTLPGFGGVAEPGKMDNAYYTLRQGKTRWLVLTLEFGPRNSSIAWANEIIRQHPNHTVIINTHSYMYSDSTRQGPGDNWRPQAYGVGKDRDDGAVNDGEDLWEKLVSKHANIRFVFSGHVLNSGVGTLVSINDAGYPVYQMLANYQEGVKGSVMGGNGWLRILDMDFRKKTCRIRTYSPFTDQYNTEPAHNFIIHDVRYRPLNR